MFGPNSKYTRCPEPHPRRAPNPPIQPPPRPVPRLDKLPTPIVQTDIFSTTIENPPQYMSLIPKPFMSGYMEKASGEVSGKVQYWSRKFVEVANGRLTFFDSMSQKESIHEVTLPLDRDTFLSLQEKRILRLESNHGVRLFRPSSELRASTWFYVMSCFCSVAPTAEGFCKKLSKRKKILEERFLKLTADGILSWYKGEDDGMDPRGSIQIRGEKITVDSDDPNSVFVNTKGRRFHFQFSNDKEAKIWLEVLEWHSQRSPMAYTSALVRNPITPSP